MKCLRVFLISVLFAGCSSKPIQTESAAPSVAPLPRTVEEAVTSSYRSNENRERDRYRHPVETLNFFGVKPTMTVIEIWPAAGWYSEILAPLLSEQGHYVAAISQPPPGSPGSRMVEKFTAWRKANPNVKVETVEFTPQQNSFKPESADMILTFRNLHNLVSAKADSHALKEFFKALKPGGILGIVDHRASSKKAQDSGSKSGYVREDYVVELALKAGFQLVAKSEVNANPLDTKDYADGVWTLPPVLKLGEKDRDKYLRIGESDRMTLKFMKPILK